MSIFRTDLQVALNDLHVAAQQSADEYENAAEFINDEGASQLLATVAQERARMTEKLERAIEKTGGLPSTPDTDRETGQQLLERLHALFSADQTADVIQQRLEREALLEKQLERSRDASLGGEYQGLHSELEHHVHTTRPRLQAELKKH